MHKICSYCTGTDPEIKESLTFIVIAARSINYKFVWHIVAWTIFIYTCSE